MHISLLMHNAYGIGGTNRTTYDLASALAEQHDVEIVPAFRHRDAPVLAPDPRVRLRHLVDLRSADPDRGHPDLERPAHSKAPRLVLRGAHPRLDALTTTTEADAGAYRARMRLPGVRIEALSNPAPAPRLAPADGTAKWVVAAGRLAPVKRYHLLVTAFDRVRTERPDWRLRICSGGEQREELINDDALRQRMAAAALHHSARFDPARIAERYESLFAGTAPRRGGLRGGELRGGGLRGSWHRGRAALLGGADALRDAGRSACRKGRPA
ncbi:glycosyltransferase [Streptomyces sp. TP-A0356]|uniref:glycosyltransferase n=1 Tax=Streptomyces sp. TP-A0356 TaxID=1359208 RepID=UPI0006E1E0A9|nr:glycosyltransferase [Streptomyces sp. TP-A0356]